MGECISEADGAAGGPGGWSRYADYKNVALFYKNTKTCNILKKMLHEILKIKKITTSKPHQGYLTPDF